MAPHILTHNKVMDKLRIMDNTLLMETNTLLHDNLTRILNNLTDILLKLIQVLDYRPPLPMEVKSQQALPQEANLHQQMWEAMFTVWAVFNPLKESKVPMIVPFFLFFFFLSAEKKKKRIEKKRKEK